MKRYTSAFSLVELSIVLVILGLLTGGILAGQSLIRAAELRSVGTEFQRYSAALGAFRDKYFAIPGDFRDATRFWGRLNSNADCVTNASALVASPGVCDGNGNGSIWEAAAGTSSEQMQFWRHLATAGLIEGIYTGIVGPGNTQDCTIGINCPASRLNRAGWAAMLNRNVGASVTNNWLDIQMTNTLVIGAPVNAWGPYGAVLRPEEAWNIDTKMDDGKSSSGKIVSGFWNDTCSSADSGVSSATNMPTSYRLTNNTVACNLYFLNAY